MSSPAAGSSISPQPQQAQRTQQQWPQNGGIESQMTPPNTLSQLPGPTQGQHSPALSTTPPPTTATPTPTSGARQPSRDQTIAPGIDPNLPDRQSEPHSTSAQSSPSSSNTTRILPSSAAPSTSITSTPRIRQWLKYLSDFSILVLITCLFVFVCIISLGAKSTNSLLAQLAPTSGILLLSFMSKLTDWGLGGATDKAWEMIRWGPLLRGRGGNLLSFLTLGAQFKGWLGVVCRTWTWLPRHGLVMKSIGSPGFWAFLRLFLWVVVQFPGLILMAVVEPQTEYMASDWTRVSGGIGVFDPSQVIQTIQGPAISNYIYSMLQDPRLTKLTDAVTDSCRASDTCQSYLMTGGLTTISPLPYLPSKQVELTAYKARDLPSYQIDAWDMTRIPMNFTGNECRLYGASSDDVVGFYLCSKNDDDGAVIAGYAPCIHNCVAIPDSSKQIFQLNSTAIKLSIYRRKTTFVADRRTSNILRIEDASFPVPQVIAASDFRPALDAILCAKGTGAGVCQPGAANFLLTDSVAWLLASSALLEFSSTLGILQNLFATSLFLFTPVWTKQTSQSTLLSDVVVEGLPDENYFQASLARPIEFVAPAPWTALAYVVSGAVLLALCFVAIVVSSLIGAPKVSSFPGVDEVRLKVEDKNGMACPNGIAGVFSKKQEDKDVMRSAVGLTVRLGDQGPAIPGP